ncbi:hypothetical protein BKA65DRAFT_593712 [Rhexocercosporidium sp. MPI-PUGE-AT-0058]|nr:hypothetical protein BKA65DRAFT_593712 [Rhexocercosporidium sp. MPI-PUGE-AT-0058]
MPKHKVQRSPNAWKKDMQVLTCLLRLRCQPPVPYPLIASLLLRTRPSLMVRLSAKVGPKVAPKDGVKWGKNMQTWLEMYLKDIYEKGEVWGSEAWKVAREWDGHGVRELVESMGMLGMSGTGDVGGENGFMVIEEEELEVQIKWRKEGDWRAGSTPLGRPERLVDEKLLRDPVTSNPVVGLEDGSSPIYHGVEAGDPPSDISQIQRSQRRQWKHTIRAQGQKQPAEQKTLASFQKDNDEADEFSPHSISTKPNE